MGVGGEEARQHREAYVVVPPWVDAGAEGEEPVGRRFLGEESLLVLDEVGLGRHPSQWWTLNCKYNAAFDVQRLNTASGLGHAAVDDRMEGDKQERFHFTRDNPDLVAYMLALHMRIVVPAVVNMTKRRIGAWRASRRDQAGIRMSTASAWVTRVPRWRG